MSQAGLIDIEGSHPQIPTSVTTDDGTAIPIANNLELLGDTVANGTFAEPVWTTASGNTVEVNVQVGSAIAGPPADNNDAGLVSFDSAVFAVDANGYVTFVGGGPGVDSIGVDANTAPGTDPVLPDGSGTITVTGAQVAAGTTANVIRTNSIAANSYQIEIQRASEQGLSTVGANGVCHFDSNQFTVDANGFVTLQGGGQSIDSVAVQTGTSPVLPDTNGLLTINGAVVAAGTNPVRTDGTGANTLAVEVQLSQALAGTDATKVGLANFDSSSFAVDANGFVTASGTGLAKTITGDTGGALAPTAGNWNIVSTATNGIETTGSGSTLTVAMASPYGDGDFSFTRANAGAGNTLTIANTSNTASAFANMQVTVGGATAADPQTTYTVTGAQSWSTGIDNSASDGFVIAASTALGTTNVLQMQVSGNVTAVLGDLSATRSNSGGTVIVGSVNQSDTASSDAYVVAQTGGSNGGDPYFKVEQTGANAWSFGLDKTDSAAFVLSQGAVLGTNNAIRASTAGEVTKPLQPCFDAYNSATDSDVTGDGTAYTIICDTEVTDQGSDYDNTTGIFTAPVAGNYLFTGTVYLQQIGASHTSMSFQLVITGGTTPYAVNLNPTVIAVSGELAVNISKIVKLTAAGTAKLNITVSGSTKTVDVRGAADGRTSFSGALIC